MYQDLSTRHDWPVKKAIVDLPIRLKGNSKHTSGNLLSPSGAQNKDIGAASKTLLTGVKLRLPQYPKKILQTDRYTILKEFFGENLMKDQSDFPLVIIIIILIAFPFNYA